MIAQLVACADTLTGLSAESPTFDLQSHSLFSDGVLAPRDVVAAAAQAGVRLLALSDHDSVDGVQEALDAAAAQEREIRVVPAVEISTLDSNGQDLHILGYLIDHRDPVLLAEMREHRAARARRAAEMTAALLELGFVLEDEPLRRRQEQGNSIGRPHLAEAVVAHPANAARLKEEGRAEPTLFLQGYLIEGRPAFRPRAAPSVEEAIAAIHRAGGLAVWAHPFWDLADAAAVLGTVERFQSSGLDGVECFYPTHTREQATLLADRCRALGLLSTGSADFHGPQHRQFSHFRAFSTYGLEAVLGPIGE